MSEEQGTKITRLTDKLADIARQDLQRRMREKLVNSMSAIIDEVVENMMKNMELSVESDLTFDVKIKK